MDVKTAVAPGRSSNMYRSAADGVFGASTMDVKTAVAPGRSSKMYRSAAEGVFGPNAVKGAVARYHVFPDEGCYGTKQRRSQDFCLGGGPLFHDLRRPTRFGGGGE